MLSHSFVLHIVFGASNPENPAHGQVIQELEFYIRLIESNNFACLQIWT